MKEIPRTERDVWLKAKALYKSRELTLGPEWSNAIYKSPESLIYALSRYKFAARLACKGRRVLEIACGEGIGVPILSEFAKSFTGVDNNPEKIRQAQSLWENNTIKFILNENLMNSFGKFDSVICINNTKHFDTAEGAGLLKAIYLNLGEDGQCVISIPGKIGHSGLEKSKDALRQYFHNVFAFSMNNEIIHAGPSKDPDYTLLLACYKKTGIKN